MPDDLIPVSARRYLSFEKLEQLRRRDVAEVVGHVDRLRAYDIARDAFTEFVGVGPDDPRLDTVELFEI